MNPHFTPCNINLIIFTDHLLELTVMLAGTMLISFFAGNLFGKTGKSKKVKGTVEFALTAPAEEVETVAFTGVFDDKINTLREEAKLKAEEWQTETNSLQQQLQTSLKEIIALENLRDILTRTVEVQQATLSEKEKKSDAAKNEINELRSTVAQLTSDNQKLNDELAAFIQAPVSVTEIHFNNEPATAITENTYAETAAKFEETIAHLREENKFLQQKLSLAEEQVLLLQPQEGQDENSMINVLQEKIITIQKEKATQLQQLKNLENQFIVNHLAAFSQVEFPEESEQNPFRRITLYIRMMEGEKTGLQNKITDTTKKLQQAEAGLQQLSAMKNEVAFLKARLNALEQDKKEYSSKAGEWETMYRKLHEKTTYLISAKETEIEQLKTNISYLEKDKSGLLKRLSSLENDLKSNSFIKNDKPFAFNI